MSRRRRQQRSLGLGGPVYGLGFGGDGGDDDDIRTPLPPPLSGDRQTGKMRFHFY